MQNKVSKARIVYENTHIPHARAVDNVELEFVVLGLVVVHHGSKMVEVQVEEIVVDRGSATEGKLAVRRKVGAVLAHPCLSSTSEFNRSSPAYAPRKVPLGMFSPAKTPRKRA